MKDEERIVLMILSSFGKERDVKIWMNRRLGRPEQNELFQISRVNCGLLKQNLA